MEANRILSHFENKLPSISAVFRAVLLGRTQVAVFLRRHHSLPHSFAGRDWWLLRLVLANFPECYHHQMFNFGKPKTAGDWVVHAIGAIIALFLIVWLVRLYMP